MKKTKERTKETKTVFKGNIISLRIDTVELSNGSSATREIIEHMGGVAILPIDSNGSVYLVRQYRKPVERALLEAPAGKLSAMEDHLDCAVRELKEETGLTAGDMTYLGYIMPSPGYTNEVIHLYLARQLTGGEQNPDEDELLEVEVYHINDVIKMCENGEISDGKTVAAVLRAKAVI